MRDGVIESGNYNSPEVAHRPLLLSIPQCMEKTKNRCVRTSSQQR